MPQSLKPLVADLQGQVRSLGAMSQQIQAAAIAPANALLQAMGAEAAAGMIATARRVKLGQGEVLWPAGGKPNLVCFPTNGVVTALAVDADGLTVQVEAVGAEGSIGLIEALAGLPHNFESRALVPADVWLVPVETLARVTSVCSHSAGVVQRHVAALYDRARRAAACNARHSMRARLADCLLAYEEKTGLARLPLTQEMLSAVLGANRTTVTALMVGLASEGLTRQGRGWVSVLDPERLDRLACGCRKDAARPRASHSVKESGKSVSAGP